jgi:hypothetical protein
MTGDDAQDHDISEGIKRNFNPRKKWDAAILVSCPPLYDRAYLCRR